jgi:hypothetical protein
MSAYQIERRWCEVESRLQALHERLLLTHRTMAARRGSQNLAARFHSLPNRYNSPPLRSYSGGNPPRAFSEGHLAW